MSYNRCKDCEYGPYSNLSDICDYCQRDPDTGFCGFTDHSEVDDDGNSLHFNSEEEWQQYKGYCAKEEKVEPCKNYELLKEFEINEEDQQLINYMYKKIFESNESCFINTYNFDKNKAI